MRASSWQPPAGGDNCERCGGKYTFAASARSVAACSRAWAARSASSPRRTAPGHAAGRHRATPSHGTFRFCLECRRYTCPSCWRPNPPAFPGLRAAGAQRGHDRRRGIRGRRSHLGTRTCCATSGISQASTCSPVLLQWSRSQIATSLHAGHAPSWSRTASTACRVRPSSSHPTGGSPVHGMRSPCRTDRGRRGRRRLVGASARPSFVEPCREMTWKRSPPADQVDDGEVAEVADAGLAEDVEHEGNGRARARWQRPKLTDDADADRQVHATEARTKSRSSPPPRPTRTKIPLRRRRGRRRSESRRSPSLECELELDNEPVRGRPRLPRRARAGLGLGRRCRAAAGSPSPSPWPRGRAR